MTTSNQPTLGEGIYPISEVARILQLPYYKVNRWISKYWDGELGKEFGTQYSWTKAGSKAINFHTLIELYVMMTFAEAGVKTRQILNAHKTLSSWYQQAFPFALKPVLAGIKTDGKKIYFRKDDLLITLDGSQQLNLDFIQLFFKKLDFDSDNLADKYWPLGKGRSIVIDPEKKLGRPVIYSHNIYPETLHMHVKAGDPIPYLAHIYGITEAQIQDALDYCEAA